MLRFARAAALLAMPLCAIAPSAAAAAITDARAIPTELAKSIATDPATVTSASYQSIAPLAASVPAGLSDVPLTSFPRNGATYAILTSGDARLADDANTAENSGAELNYTAAPSPARGALAFDTLTLRIDVNVPASANCLIMRFRFLSDEFPEYVNSEYNDAFIAELDSTSWKAQNDGTGTPQITAPQNFAFDEASNPITINATGASTVSAANATGTTYDAATRRLASAKLAAPGAHQLYLSVFDMADELYDSAVFVDGLEFRNVDAAKCTGSAFQDDVAPNLNTGAPSSTPEPLIVSGQSTRDDTPTFGGRAGTTLNDEPTVVGQIFPAATARAVPLTGTPIQQKTATVGADGSWTITADKLPEGSYQFQASQRANNGEKAYNDAIAFSIDRTAPALTATTTLYGGKTRDTTPLLTGLGGVARGDVPGVNLGLFAGTAAAGNPVTLRATQLIGQAWSFPVAQVLNDGVYTALARQTDAAGNAGASAPLTFRVTTTNPIGKVKFPKRFKRAVIARRVAGRLKFDFPGKATFALTAKIGRRSYKLGSVTRTLKAPGTAKFSIKPSRAHARRIRRGRGTIKLRTTFRDDQNRTYRTTQRVAFRR